MIKAFIQKQTRFSWTVYAFLIVIFAVRSLFLSKVMTHGDDINLLCEIFIPRKGFISNVLDLRAHNTGQWYFILHRFLFRLATNYDSILFWNRLPSLVLWTAGLFFYFQILQKYLVRKDITIFLLILGAVSWRGFIESSQASNYSLISVLTPIYLYIFVSVFPIQMTKIKLAAIGYLLGSILWFHYTSFFMAAAGFLTSFIWILLYERGPNIKLRLKELALVGLGYGAAFVIVFNYHLKHMRYQGISGYSGSSPPAGFLENISFIFTGWFNIVRNVITFLPWDSGAPILAGIAIAIILYGLLHKSENLVEKKIRIYLFSLAFVWLFFVYFKHLPLSPTRHTYIFQFPVLILLGYALKKMKVRPFVVYGLACITAGLTIANFNLLWVRIENKIDPKYILELADQNPDAVVMGILNTMTWDPVLLTIERPDLTNRLLLSESWWAQVVRDPAIHHLILISHRRPLDEENILDLASHGYTKIVKLRAIDPVGSTELSSNLNGGNGFYVFDVRK